MKVFPLAPHENWICDRFVDELVSYGPFECVKDPQDADVIWLVADWCWQNIPISILREKIIVATVHHIVPEKFGVREKYEFAYRDQFIDLYHVTYDGTKDFISNLTNRPIFTQPFWVNQYLWYTDNVDRCSLKEGLGIDPNVFLIGSFQRDTEGHDLKSPKLEKGPDLFCDMVEKYHKLKSQDNVHVEVLLGGWRRQYVMKRLDGVGIKYHYFELPDLDTLRKMYNSLDLYIVAARIEGGPQAIVECAAMNVPIISTDVGLARTILSEDSLFTPKNIELAIPSVTAGYNNVSRYFIPHGFENFEKRFLELFNC